MSATSPAKPAPRLLDQVRTAIRVRHYSTSTEKNYCYWIRFFIRFHNMRHPPAGAGFKPAHHSGVARSRGCAYHRDLYPCVEDQPGRRAQPRG